MDGRRHDDELDNNLLLMEKRLDPLMDLLLRVACSSVVCPLPDGHGASKKGSADGAGSRAGWWWKTPSSFSASVARLRIRVRNLPPTRTTSAWASHSEKEVRLRDAKGEQQCEMESSHDAHVSEKMLPKVLILINR